MKARKRRFFRIWLTLQKNPKSQDVFGIACSLRNRRFMSQARGTRHFLLPSSRASHSFRASHLFHASRKIPPPPRLVNVQSACYAGYIVVRVLCETAVTPVDSFMKTQNDTLHNLWEGKYDKVQKYFTLGLTLNVLSETGLYSCRVEFQ